MGGGAKAGSGVLPCKAAYSDNNQRGVPMVSMSGDLLPTFNFSRIFFPCLLTHEFSLNILCVIL